MHPTHTCNPFTYLDSHYFGTRCHANHTLCIVLGTDDASTVCAVAIPVISRLILANDSENSVSTYHVEVGVVKRHAGVKHCNGDVCCRGGSLGTNGSNTARACGERLCATGDEGRCVGMHRL